MASVKVANANVYPNTCLLPWLIFALLW